MGGWWRCLFAGDPTVDLSVPRRWEGEGLNRLRSFICLFRSLEFFSSFSRSFDSDQECDSAWSPDETIIWRFFSVSHSFGEVCASWPDITSRFLGLFRIRLAHVRSCGWFSVMGTCGEFLLSVLSPEFWRFLWQHVTRHGTAYASLWLSLSSGVGFLTVAVGRFFRRRCARHVPLLCVCGGLNGCIRSRDWRVGDSNLQFPISNDGTTCQWTPLRAVGEAILNGFLLVALRFEPPFSPGARGNMGLSPLILFPWAIDATLTPVCL
ncbi:hypothetical protein F2Q70_00019017 [Brassica cretica]|uniref:Uncharacterized protein n=1 Tax=Brassica cretica TaxID=69181 RepID=A0A8S9HVM1_BRACR|nr:hypothetical protein F2Q70_00019017 [Brassica cretica]KAF2599282.1 hypothetical protein F2Q68_00012577 [Brassica cretica]